MDHYLSLKDVRDMFSASNYRKGHSYYTLGRVKDLIRDTESSSWKAVVRGTENYKVTILEDENGFDWDCNCPAFARYELECKHVVAVMLKVQESKETSGNHPNPAKQAIETMHQRLQRQQEEYLKQQLERQAAYVKQLTNDFIQTFAFHQKGSLSIERSGEKKPLLVEWSCKAYKNYNAKFLLSVEMKVGYHRKYVVKNVKEFLKAIKLQNQLYFAKNFTYDPSEYTFTNKDRELIDLLQEAVQNEEMIKSMVPSYYQYGSSGDERAITISPMIADRVIEKLVEIKAPFVNSSQKFPELQFYSGSMPFQFQLGKGNSDAFQLDLSELMFVEYLDLYGYLLKQNQIFKLSPVQLPLMKQLKQLIGRANTPVLPISHEQIEPLLSYVVPMMDDVGELKIDDSISSKIMKFPLEANLYVDVQDHFLNVKLEFRYGENTFLPFQPKPVHSVIDPILIKDTEKEGQIMKVIESSPLTLNGEQLYLKGEEAIYDFLFETLPKLEEMANIFLTNAVKSMILPERKGPVSTIDVDSSGNWLEVRFSMEEIEQADIEKILRSAIEKKKYYRLPNGAFVSLESDEFQTIQHMFDDLNIHPTNLKQNSLRLPLYRGVQLAELYEGEKGTKAKYSKTFRKLLNSLKNPDELDFVLPNSLRAELRDYQNYGFQWLSTLKLYGFGGILADDMGLGKTLQSIALLVADKDKHEETKPSLIVAPASLIYNWKNELEKFAPSLQAEVIFGSPQERLDILHGKNKSDVWITSYPTLRQDIEYYSSIEFRTLILDEAQAIKNHATKTAKAVREIKAGTCIALSGTPIENSLDELWSIFQTVMPDFFPNQKTFRQLAPEKIGKMIKPFLLRRLKKDVLKELPDKIETVHVSELTKPQKELYLAYLEKIKSEAQDSLQGEGFQKSRIKILAGLTRLRQLCCHPGLFLENYKGDSGKLQQLLDTVTNALENGKRLLIFSQFTSMLQLIGQALSKGGISFFYLDGQTASKERVQLVDRFNQGESNIFLISLKAGNTGLNLTGADTVILYDLWWNPAVEEQAAGRAHRMGQKNVVQVIRLISKGTIEEKMYELQQTKRELIETVMEQGDQALSRITEEDIRGILGI
jgi:superfamily II DNA or RNA helicase